MAALFSNSDPAEFVFSNGYFNTIIFNYYNTIGSHLEMQSQEMTSDIYDKLGSTQTELIVALIVLIVLSMFSMVLSILLMVYIKDSRENILFLFLDIPMNHIDYLYRHCDSFLKKYVSMQELIKKNENSGFESSDDEEDDEDDERGSGKGNNTSMSNAKQN